MPMTTPANDIQRLKPIVTTELVPDELPDAFGVPETLTLIRLAVLAVLWEATLCMLMLDMTLVGKSVAVGETAA